MSKLRIQTCRRSDSASRRAKLGRSAIALIALLLLASAGCGSSPSRDESNVRIRDSVRRQLTSTDRIQYSTLAKQAFLDSGWHDERLLELWLRPVAEGARALRMLEIYEDSVVWLWMPASPSDEISGYYSIVLAEPLGPLMSWQFYVDGQGFVRGYVETGRLN